MKHQKFIGSAIAASTLLGSTAYADGGSHGHFTLENLIHWLSSPTHSLFAVAGGLAFIAVATVIIRKKRA